MEAQSQFTKPMEHKIPIKEVTNVKIHVNQEAGLTDIELPNKRD